MKKKKVLFLDRDGTLIKEPEDQQIDSLEKFEFLPFCISSLAKIVQDLDYDLVMVSNQDGLGTSANPLEKFNMIQELLLKTLKSEGIEFSAIFIDPSYPEDKSINRKPNTGMLGSYLGGNYDLSESIVIGDRTSDVQLAKNLSCKSIYIGKQINEADFCTEDWREIYDYLKAIGRKSNVNRASKETKIDLSLNLDGSGKATINTGLPFFDHMLEQLCTHGGVDLKLIVQADLEVDDHHCIEDCALALGQAFSEALGSKKGIARYGFLLPMDESLAQVAIDFGGRSELIWKAQFNREKIGDCSTELFKHFFKSFCDTAHCNLNIQVEGENEHHKIESIFKAWSRAIKMAIRQEYTGQIPSSKGIL